MKILFVIDSLHGGGAARVTTILADELVKLGYEIAIATNRVTRKCVYPCNEAIHFFNFYRERYAINNSIIKILDHSILLRKVINIFNPDIIVGEQENGVLYARLALLFSSKPLIGHRHNTFKILGLSKIQSYLFNSTKYSVLLHNEDVKYVGNRIKHAIAIYNPCSFSISHIPQSKKKKIIMVVGSTKRYLDKGFDIIIDVWSKIEADYNNWQLHIVGGGSESNDAILKNKAKELNIEERIVFTGFVSDVERRLSEASIFALPSRVEGFPMVINEAISQGCACLSFALSDVMPELYSDKAVLVSKDGDIDSFTQNLRRMIEDEKLRNQLSSNSQKELKKYLPEEIVKEWVHLFEKVK